jgi:hypothetical protein
MPNLSADGAIAEPTCAIANYRESIRGAFSPRSSSGQATTSQRGPLCDAWLKCLTDLLQMIFDGPGVTRAPIRAGLIFYCRGGAGGLVNADLRQLSQGREHRVPWSPAVIALLDALPRMEGTDLDSGSWLHNAAANRSIRIDEI